MENATPPDTEKEMELITSADSTEIAFEQTGNGPPLLLVHGGLGDHTRWGPLTSHLESHVTVYAMDRRGRGASGDTPEYAVEREFEDVAAVVDAVADASDSTVDVYGVSSGANFAIGAAALTSNIGRLMLYEPGIDSGMKVLPDGLPEQMDELLDAGKREEAVELLFSEGLQMTDEELSAYRDDPSWPSRVDTVHTLPRELRIPPERYFDPEQAAAISIPTLLLVGEESPAHLKEDTEPVIEALSDARIEMLHGQAHSADIVAPELVAEKILAFRNET